MEGEDSEMAHRFSWEKRNSRGRFYRGRFIDSRDADQRGGRGKKGKMAKPMHKRN